ncbi:UNVERIFIED_ORG: hypothetical protein ABID57_000724 [Arthrobacter sp. UYEF1]
MRKKQVIEEAEEEFFDRIWYERKLVMREAIQAGEEDMPPRHIMRGMLLAVTDVQRKYGKGNLGPYSEFEWGMINGKLSALRWVLGDDWDNLDT